MSWSISGKTVVITGSSRGIGRVAALSLAGQGAAVSLVVRNRELGEKVAAEIAAAGAPTARVFVADLSSIREVRRVGAELCAAHEKIDVLINNAGAIYMKREETVEGLERTFATNHMAYFVLTNALLEPLKRGAPSRIVNVSSEAHRVAMNWDDLLSEKSYGGMQTYGRSKLANILFTRAIARRLEAAGVTANSLHPGVIGSNFGHNDNGFFSFLAKLGRPFLATEADGAKTTIYLASSPEVAGVTGKYFSKSRVAKPRHHAEDDAGAERLWDYSEALASKFV